jgi:hypothetical protein
VANALDRTRFQRVRSVKCEVNSGEVRLTVEAGSDAQVEIWDAKEKAQVLEKALGAKVSVLPQSTP